jgi:TPR repeat protein
MSLPTGRRAGAETMAAAERSEPAATARATWGARPAVFRLLLRATLLLVPGIAACGGAAPDAAACPSADAEACYRKGLAAAADAVKAQAGSPARAQLQVRAKALMRDSCEQGYGQACFALARQLLIGNLHDAAARAEAADLYEEGCGLGGGAACNGLGEAYAYAVGRPRDSVRALAAFRRGCDLGNPTACYRASRRIAEHLPELGSQRFVQAAALADSACDLGSMNGCIMHAYDLEQSLRRATPEVYGRARYAADRDFVVETYRSGCDRGFAVGCNNLGALFEDRALGFSPDTASARLHYRRGCYGNGARDRRSGGACKNLGDLLPDSAYSLYSLGCDMLWPPACAALAGLRNQDGRSLISMERAALLAATACLQQAAEGCAVAGQLHGLGHLADGAAQRRYYRRGCELADPGSCGRLAFLLSSDGSPLQAVKYYRRACELPTPSTGCADLADALDYFGAGDCLRKAGASRPVASCGGPPSQRRRIVGRGTVRGTLGPGDAVMYDGSRYDEWVVRAAEGERLRISLASAEFDALLSVGRLMGGEFVELSGNDDLAEGATDARVVLVAPATEDLVVRVNTFGPEPSGGYTLAVER